MYYDPTRRNATGGNGNWGAFDGASPYAVNPYYSQNPYYSPVPTWGASIPGTPWAGTPPFTYGVAYPTPYSPFAYGAPSYPHPYGYSAAPEIPYLSMRLDHIQLQLGTVIDTLRRLVPTNIHGDFNTVGYGTLHGIFNNFGVNAFYGESGFCRVRESDSNLFLEYCLPQLTMSDVEIEVIGNRVCVKTRVPVAPMYRWWHAPQALRGFECFEQPDGRVELSYVVPVAFQANEVEATWREGWCTICVPKTEGNQKHTVKVTKEGTVGGTQRRNGPEARV